MHHSSKYDWHLLQKQGDFIIIPDKLPKQVKTASISYLNRVFGHGNFVSTTVAIPGGTYVSLCWIADESQISRSALAKDLESDDTVQDPDDEIAEYLDEEISS